MSKTVYIGVGSNIGDKLEYCRKAIDLVDKIPGCRVTAQSDFFQTAPVGVNGQDWYVNNVISLEADISANKLLENLLSIEAGLGRERKKKWDSRTIDLDILLFASDIIDEKDLSVPHPFMHLRKFVLVPLVQLKPDLIHPVSGIIVSKLLDSITKEDQSIFPLEEI